MRNLKRVLSALLVLIMCVGMLPTTALADAPFDSEDKVTLRVYTSRDGYILDKVTFKLDSKSVDIEPFDTKLTLGGMTYTVKWIDNTEFSIEFAPLPGSISVSSKTVKGDVEEAPEVPDENDNPLE